MGLMDELKRLARPYEDDEEFEEEETSTPTPIDRGRRTAADAEYTKAPAASASSGSRSVGSSGSRSAGSSEQWGGRKVVNMSVNTTTQLKVVLVRPQRFEDASEIADHLRDKRTVVLNLEDTEQSIARRLVDFLSGVAYAQEGKIKKVALSTYIITPYNVDFIGDKDILDELESSGVYSFHN